MLTPNTIHNFTTAATTTTTITATDPTTTTTNTPSPPTHQPNQTPVELLIPYLALAVACLTCLGLDFWCYRRSNYERYKRKVEKLAHDMMHIAPRRVTSMMRYSDPKGTPKKSETRISDHKAALKFMIKYSDPGCSPNSMKNTDATGTPKSMNKYSDPTGTPKSMHNYSGLTDGSKSMNKYSDPMGTAKSTMTYSDPTGTLKSMLKYPDSKGSPKFEMRTSDSKESPTHTTKPADPEDTPKSMAKTPDPRGTPKAMMRCSDTTGPTAMFNVNFQPNYSDYLEKDLDDTLCKVESSLDASGQQNMSRGHNGIPDSSFVKPESDTTSRDHGQTADKDGVSSVDKPNVKVVNMALRIMARRAAGSQKKSLPVS